MSAAASDPNDPPAPTSINGWVQRLIDFGNRRSRQSSFAVVAGLVLFLGWIDYITDNRVSLYAFYLAPIIFSALWLGWRAGCVVSVTCILVRVGGDWLAVGETSININIFWNRIGHLSLYLVLVGLLHALMTLHTELERRVQQRTAALAQALRSRDELQRQLLETGGRERSRLGHELHDGLGQHLTATAFAAKMLSEELESSGHPGAAHARAIVRMTQDGIAQTRQLARGLLLATIEPDQLAAELDELCRGLEKESGVACRFTRDGDLRGLDGERASHLYYIAHEAARNALRHARPNLIEIALKTLPDRLELSIVDDGSGPPDPGEKLSGMGLRIMAHRSELIGGRFAIAPGDGAGAVVTCAIALPAT